MKRLSIALIVLFSACCSSDVDKPFGSHLQNSIDRNVDIEIPGVGSCAGVIIETNRVATAKHCKGAVMLVDNEPATIEKESPDQDVMVLGVKTKQFRRVKFATIADGQRVYSIVNISGLRDIVSRGSVMGFQNHRILVQNLGAPGISGGGYYDEWGRLIGIGSQYQGTVVTGQIVQEKFLVGQFSIAVESRAVLELLESK